MPNLVDPTNWENMAGDSDVEKKINSYLSSQFISKKELPADECLSEAKSILDMVFSHTSYRCFLSYYGHKQPFPIVDPNSQIHIVSYSSLFINLSINLSASSNLNSQVPL